MPIISSFPTKCNVSGSVVASKTLNENSWEVIRAVSDSNQGENYWSIGDTKSIEINGRIGATTFNHLKIDVFIIGFNHNAEKEGNGKIHFLIGKVDNKMVGICDDKYVSEQDGASEGYFCMNPTNIQTNKGGWEASYMRKTILGADHNPNSPAENTMLAALPADLRGVMKPVTKYSDNTGGGRGSKPEFITATTDYLFLLGESELVGHGKYANSYETYYQRQYEFFKLGNKTVAYKHDDPNKMVFWSLRSATWRMSNHFCIVIDSDHPGNNDAATSDSPTAILAGFVV